MYHFLNLEVSIEAQPRSYLVCIMDQMFLIRWLKRGFLFFDSYVDNSKHKHHWALRTFEQWRNTRNHLVRKGSFTGIPIDKHFNEMDVNELNYAVPRFIHEVSKKDHSFYPAETLYSLVVCLQACCHARGFVYKFFDDAKFTAIHNTLDNRMKRSFLLKG